MANIGFEYTHLKTSNFMPSLQLLLSQLLVPFIFNCPLNEWQMYRGNIINLVVHFLEKRTVVLGKM